MYESHQTEQYKTVYFQTAWQQHIQLDNVQVAGYKSVSFEYDIYMNEVDGVEFVEIDKCKVSFQFGIGNPAIVTVWERDIKKLQEMGFPLEEILEETRFELGAVKKLARGV